MAMNGEPEDVLGKADALMRRHRSFVAGAPKPPADSDEDVPVLTDEVDLDGPAAPDALDAQQRIAEILNRLEPEIASLVQQWLATELPHLVAKELGALAPRLIQATHQSLEQALLPELSRLIRESDDRGQGAQGRS